MPRYKILNAFHLKVIMAVLMVLDHLYYNLFPSLLWGHILARTVAPVFCYLMAEGMRYTRSRARYIGRIFTFAGAMLAGNVILYLLFGHWIENGILLSLGIGAALIACIDNARAASTGRRILWILAVIGCGMACFVVIGDFHVEGTTMVPMMAVLFYYLHRRPVLMWSLYFLLFCVQYLFFIPSYGLLTQFWMVLAIVPIVLYNGQRGHNGPGSKYFFYIFYPVHIWFVFLLEQFSGVGH